MRYSGGLRSWPRGGTRHWSRMIPAGIGIIALVVIALHGRSASSSVLRLSGETAWLASTAPGIVSDISGSAAAPDASVSISAMRGHHVSVIQDGSMVLTADRDTGMAWLISPSQLAVEKSFKMGPAGSVPLSAGRQIYDIDQSSGTIQYVRSLPSSPVRAAVNLRIGPGDSVIGAGGILWVARSSDGNILPVRQGKVGRAWRVAPPHDNLALTSAGNSAVVANASTGVVTSISPLADVSACTCRSGRPAWSVSYPQDLAGAPGRPLPCPQRQS